MAQLPCITRHSRGLKNSLQGRAFFKELLVPVVFIFHRVHALLQGRYLIGMHNFKRMRGRVHRQRYNNPRK